MLLHMPTEYAPEHHDQRMHRATVLALASLVGPLAFVLLVAGVRFTASDPSMPIYVTLVIALAGIGLAVAAVVAAVRSHRARRLAWTALALNLAPVAIYAIAVVVWLNSGGD